MIQTYTTLPPGPASTPLKTRQPVAICLRLASALFERPSFTRVMIASKSAVLSALITLKTTPASEVNRRDAGTAGGGGAAWPAAGAPAAGGCAGGCWGGCAAAGEPAASATLRNRRLNEPFTASGLLAAGGEI